MTEMNTNEVSEKKSLNFIEQAVEKDLSEGKNGNRVQTRFPPEPNGYLHIGHAKAICLDFGIAARYGGVCNLRFDDTNPTKEDMEYVEAIKEDIQWLGFQWGNEYYASDYFQQLWDFAIRLIKEGKAYIDEQPSETIAAQKGTPTQPGTESPFRNRPAEESLELFQKMNSGKIEEGKMVLRAKIDMASPNMHFRDPIIYRVVKHPHHRTGETWKAYPMYDFAHGQSDFFEGVTHSLCTLEFVPHRPLYDLFVDWVKEEQDLDDNRPRQYEFNKLNLNYTLMSKRNLLILVKEGLVNGWDDPRMPTICGFRRRGYSPESIRNFVDKIGYTTYDALNDFALLESAVRDDLNKRSTRVSAVIDPVKLIITNYPEGQVEAMEAINNPEDPNAGTHFIEFSRELWMEREDFMENAPKKYFRMTPGQEVRLKNAYIVKCTGCDKDENGNITTVYAEYDPDTKTGMPGSSRKVKGTLHWVSCNHCLKAEVRLYDRLWKVENPRDEMSAIREAKGCDALEAMKEMINEDSLKVLTECYVEKFLADAKPLDYLQFQRIGYFNVDKDSTPDHLVFNRTVSLKDTWSKIKNKKDNKPMNNDLSSYFEDPEFKDLLAKYEGMVESHTPTYFDAEELTDIAEYYASQDEEQKAEDAIDMALRLHPSNTDALVFKSRSLCIKGRLNEAYQIMNLIEDPSDREVQFLKADLLMEERRMDEAEAVFQALAETENESMEVLLDIALIYMDANQKDYAAKWLDKIRNKGYNETNSQKFRDAWCDFCMTFGEAERATQAFQLSLDELPYSIPHWNGLAKCYLAQNNIEKAHESVDFALAIDENDAEALEVKGFCYIQSENYEEALNIYHQLLPQSKSPSRIYAFLAKCYMELEKAQEAKSTCIEWLKACPKLTGFEISEVYSYISLCCFNLYQPEEGMKYIDAALDLEPSFRGAILQKGMLYLQMNENKEAEKLFKRVLDISPDDEQSEIMYNVANAYFFLHMYPGTIEWCEKIIEGYPTEQTEALYLTACSYYSMFDIESCLKYLTRIWNDNHSFDDDFLEDKRFKHMFTNIALLSKKYRQQD